MAFYLRVFAHDKVHQLFVVPFQLQREGCFLNFRSTLPFLSTLSSSSAQIASQNPIAEVRAALAPLRTVTAGRQEKYDRRATQTYVGL